MIIEGVISSLEGKTITAGTGKQYTVYSATIGSDVVNIGFNQDKLQEGQTVKLDNVVVGKYGLELPRTPKKGGSPNAAPSNVTSINQGGSSARPGSGNFAPKTFPVGTTHGDISIIRQSALKAAVDTIALTGAGKTATLEKLADQAIALAYKYAAFSSGQKEVEEVKDLTKEIKDNAASGQ